MSVDCRTIYSDDEGGAVKSNDPNQGLADVCLQSQTIVYNRGIEQRLDIVSILGRLPRHEKKTFWHMSQDRRGGEGVAGSA